MTCQRCSESKARWEATIAKIEGLVRQAGIEVPNARLENKEWHAAISKAFFKVGLLLDLEKAVRGYPVAQPPHIARVLTNLDNLEK